MGARMRAIDWSLTPLGPVEAWPQSLRTCVRIVLTSRQPMFVWWGESLINLYNDAYRSILGGKHPEALGQPASKVWREIWEHVAPRAAAAMKGNEGTYDEALLLIMERNGYQEETYYTFSYSPVPSDDGTVGGLICANTDDTQRIIDERQLALLRDQAALTLGARTIEEACVRSASALAKNAIDLPFALIYLSDAYAGALDLVAVAGVEKGRPASPHRLERNARWPWPVADVVAGSHTIVELGAGFGPLPCGAWTRPPEKAVVLPLGTGSRRSGVLVVGLSPHRLFDDGYRSFLEIVAGQISSSIATADAHEEERRRREALAEIDRAKTAFFSNVSHEFRTPLTLMLAPIEDMRALPARDAAEAERLDLLHRNALRLKKLVNHLLDFSRIEAGRVQAEFRPVDLAAFTSELASSFRSAANRAGLSLEVDCQPLLEPAYVDPSMWEKIVLNLLSNALKFTFEGKIRVALEADAANIRLVVQDTGTGVPEHELPRLFERFHRVAGARARSHEGSGIGLALVHELVRIHGGDVQVASRVGEGTTFQVRIPLGHLHLPREQVRNEPAGPRESLAEGYVEEAARWGAPSDEEPRPSYGGAAIAEREPGRILVVDDNADMRDYLTRILRERWHVQVAADGLEALATIRREPPDLVLSDVMMPGLDGFGLLRAVRGDASLSEIPFVLLSARAGEEATSEGLSAGADDYLVKPFSARDLVVRVAARLAQTRAHRELAEHRKDLYRAFMQAPFPVGIFRGPDHVIEALNDSILALWDRGPEIVGRHLWDVFPEMRDQQFPRLLDEVYRSGVAYQGREELARFSRRSGEIDEHYLTYVFAPLFGRGLKVEGVLVCAIDATAEVRNRAAVVVAREAERRRLLTMLQQVPAIVNFLRGPDLVFELAHPSTVRAVGGRDILGKPLLEAIPEHAGQPFYERLLEVYRTGIPFEQHGVEAHFRSNGEDVTTYWDSVYLPVPDDAGRIEGVMTFDVDVTQSVLIRRELEHANRAKDEFLATMSHELRTPLNAILGWTTILENNLTNPDKLRRGIEVIARNVRAQERIIGDLLDVSRIINGKLQLALQPTDVRAVMQAAADAVRPAADSKGVELVVRVAPDVRSVVADPDRIQQAVWNLLTNAVRFTPRGGRVTATAQRAESFVEIDVVDTGLGISAEQLPHIFERFRQVDSSTTRAHGGLGLGLAIVRHLIEAHGGSVEAWSEGENRGATFRLRLPTSARGGARPAQQPGRPAPRAEPAPRPVSAPEPRGELEGVRLLVLDDDADSLEILRLVLCAAGATVVTATNAFDALEASGPFDLIISDIGMPRMDGYMFLETFRARASGPRTPAVALTAFARREDAERARAAGYDVHLTKPVNLQELFATVKRCLAPSR